MPANALAVPTDFGHLYSVLTARTDLGIPIEMHACKSAIKILEECIMCNSSMG